MKNQAKTFEISIAAKDRVNAGLQHTPGASEMRQLGVPALDTAKPEGDDGLAGLSANWGKATA